MVRFYQFNMQMSIYGCNVDNTPKLQNQRKLRTARINYISVINAFTTHKDSSADAIIFLPRKAKFPTEIVLITGISYWFTNSINM